MLYTTIKKIFAYFQKCNIPLRRLQGQLKLKTMQRYNIILNTGVKGYSPLGSALRGMLYAIG